MYSAAPLTRLTQGAGVTAGGLSSTWSSGLQTLHIVVAVTSLLALVVAMTKLLPGRGGSWATSPVSRLDSLATVPRGSAPATP